MRSHATFVSCGREELMRIVNVSLAWLVVNQSERPATFARGVSRTNELSEIGRVATGFERAMPSDGGSERESGGDDRIRTGE
jgi:hypothetical protein